MSVNDHALSARLLTREMTVHRLPLQVRNLIDLVRLLTLDHVPPRDAAPVDDVRDLEVALLMDRRDRERAEKAAIELQILSVVRGGGRWWYELLPLPDEWPDRPAGRRSDGSKMMAPSFEVMQASRDAWMRLDRCTAETAQRELPLALRPEVDGTEEGARNREGAAARERGSVNLGETPPKLRLSEAVAREVGGDSPKTDGGDSPRLQTPARTRAPEHGHGHGTPSVPQSMVPCDHGRSVAKEEDRFAGMSEEDLQPLLDGEGEHWDGQLPDIFGEQGDDFRLMWLKRFCDTWSGCAYRAIGEIKSMQIAGKAFTKGPGQYANFLFNKYRYASFKRAKAMEKKA